MNDGKKKIQRSKIILKILNRKFILGLKNTNSFLKHIEINLHLLISVLLSAQTTDVNVNNVTKNIYPKYNKPEDEAFVKLGRKKLKD